VQPVTFNTLIARNKRNSYLLIAFFMLFFIAFGVLIGEVWGQGDRTFRVGVPVAAGALAFLLTLFSYFGGPSALLGMSNARQIAKSDDPELFNVIEELAIAGGTPMPRVFVIDSPAMNAFATGRNPKHAAVAITAGLRHKLSRDELQGVMAHELCHIRNYDILYSMLMAVLVGTLVMLADVFVRSMYFGGMTGRSRRRNSKGGGGGQIIIVVIALVLAILAPILARIIQMALSRQREYLADAASVDLTRNPQGLASALAKLSGDREILESANRATAPLYIVPPVMRLGHDARNLLSTHPPLKERIDRLMSLTK
jgi:heat shock protein HtpX